METTQTAVVDRVRPAPTPRKRAPRRTGAHRVNGHVAKQGSAAAAKPDAGEPMTRKEYEKELKKLQGELVKVQLWAKHTGAKVCVIFEGRDAAGKGGVIKTLTERTSPRVFRIAALPAPTEREKGQMYMQRYMAHLPSPGEVVLFDRSWYNRAGVERVLGFCEPKQVKRFLEMCPRMESAMINSGIQLIKYWFEVSQEEQTRRFKDRISDPRKIWKLSGMDLESHRLWYDFSRARDAMFMATDTNFAPWRVAPSNRKKTVRLNIINDILKAIPYKALPREKIKLPARQKPGDYVEPNYPYKVIPQAY